MTQRTASNPDRFAAAARRTAIARLYLQALPQMEIARRLGLNQSTVSRHLKTLQQEWLAARVRDLDAHTSRELARIDLVEQEAWTQWERSKEYADTTITEQQQGGAAGIGRRARVQKISKVQCGDPRYLQVIDDCIDRRAKLLGLYAPTQHAHTGAGGTPLEFTVLIDRAGPDDSEQ